MSAIFRAPDSITEADVAAMRAHWHAAEADEREPSIRPRDLRFCRVGEVLTHSTTGEWWARLADLLRGTLDRDLAPCTRVGSGRPDEVRSVHSSSVDWSGLEDREWIALERAGLPRLLRLQLQHGEESPEPQDPAHAAAHAAALAAARALLEHVPDGPPSARAEACAELTREAIYGQALAEAGGSRERAAHALGVAASRVSEAVARYPALARAWPPGPRGRAPRE